MTRRAGRCLPRAAWAASAIGVAWLLAGCAVPPVPPAETPAPPPVRMPVHARPPAAASASAAPAAAPAPADAPPAAEAPATEPEGEWLGRGLASWYGPSLHGRRTASGERFDRYEFTAAHRTLPFGARVCVRSVLTGKAVVVRINDRGPFAPGRVIDLSQAAAQELGMVGLGIKPVELWNLGPDEDRCPDGLRDAEAAGDEEPALAPATAPAPRKARPPRRRKKR